MEEDNRISAEMGDLKRLNTLQKTRKEQFSAFQAARKREMHPAVRKAVQL